MIKQLNLLLVYTLVITVKYTTKMTIYNTLYLILPFIGRMSSYVHIRTTICENLKF